MQGERRALLGVKPHGEQVVATGDGPMRVKNSLETNWIGRNVTAEFPGDGQRGWRRAWNSDCQWDGRDIEGKVEPLLVD